MAACGASCAGRARIEPHARPTATTGRLQLLKYDANGDGRVDTWSHMDGARILRIEIDTNHDGASTGGSTTRPDGRLREDRIVSRAGRNAGFLGLLREDGSIARLDLSTQATAGSTESEFTNKAAVVRAEEDTSGDGRIDKWEVYEGSRLASVAFDTTSVDIPTAASCTATDGSAQPEAVESPFGPALKQRPTYGRGLRDPAFLYSQPPFIRNDTMDRKVRPALLRPTR